MFIESPPTQALLQTENKFDIRTSDGKDEWLTPPEIIKALGEFDLDPCSPINRPWDTAKRHYTIIDDGLKSPWFGRVWMNPPYGNQTGRWLEKMANHGNGTVLIFARTETKDFFKFVWDKADAILFIKGRLAFYHVTGEKAKSSGGAPSCLVAYGIENVTALKHSGIEGKFITL
jgi:hypothetical protein